MTSDPKGNEYRAFLLRIWREPDGPGATWRCSLEDPATRARRGFDGVEALGAFLLELCGEDRRGAGDASATAPSGTD